MKHVYQRAARRQGARRRLGWLAAALGGVLLIGLSFAFLHAIAQPALNPFTFGEPKVTIDEEFDGWDVKRVKLRNDDSVSTLPGVVRAMPVIVLKDKDTGDGAGGDYDPENEIGLQLADGWETKWFLKDGFYYYRQVLLPGEETSRLMEKAFLINDTPQMRLKYAGVTVEIEIMADILQATGGAPESAWGVYVTGMAVSPTP